MVLQGEKREELERKLQEYVGVVIEPPDKARDAVNQAMIRHWCDAMGDTNPAYIDPDAAKNSVHGGIVAPPTMMQAWTMAGYEMSAPATGPPRNEQRGLHALLDDYGFSSVVATNCEQEYTRYLVPGDLVSATTTIESVSEQKATALGIGYFIDTRSIYRDQTGEQIGWMTFRVLKFAPNEQPQAAAETGAAPAAPQRLRPTLAHDNVWWWEGIERGELLIQKCSDCGELRHPARPMCGKCGSINFGSVVSTGRGTVYSHVTLHHPQIPGYEFPLAVALIDLEEGTRIVSNVVGCKPEEVHIGMPVRLSIENVDEEMKLPLFRPDK